MRGKIIIFWRVKIQIWLIYGILLVNECCGTLDTAVNEAYFALHYVNISVLIKLCCIWTIPSYMYILSISYMIGKVILFQHVCVSNISEDSLCLTACTNNGSHCSNTLWSVFISGYLLLKSWYTSFCFFLTVWILCDRYCLGPMRYHFNNIIFIPCSSWNVRTAPEFIS